MAVLSIEGLCKHYARFTLEDVSFHVGPGEIMGFIGRNGAGKTTTLKSILNIVHPDSGVIRYFGMELAGKEGAIKERIGFVSGGVDYYVHKRIRTITEVYAGFYSNWDAAAYQRYLNLFELEESKTPAELSAGMKVKYNLALALSHHAELLILDEPTSGLDPVSRDDLLDVFLRLSQEGVAILFSTHITSDLDQCADGFTYIMGGKILASESLSAFVDRYRLVRLEEAQLTETLQKDLIGCKPAKHGYTALVSSQQTLGLPVEAADLETIMVHLEKEREA